MNQTPRRKEKVREMGRITFYVASSKDSSYYVCTQPILSWLPLQHTTTLLAVHKGRMWQKSTCPVELKTPLKRTLEKAGQGCSVFSSCPKNTLIAEVEFFWMTAILLLLLTKMRQQLGCVVKSLGKHTQAVLHVSTTGSSIMGTP